jgi:hypothetical protein
VKSFQTCGYYPFSFEASYANRQVPPTSSPGPEDDDDNDEMEWEDISDMVTNDNNTTMQSPPTTPTLAPSPCSIFEQIEIMPLHQHLSYSSPQPQRLRPHPIQTLPSSTPTSSPCSQHLHQQKPLLWSLQACIATMKGNTTPRQARVICKAALSLVRVDCAHNECVTTLLDITEMQQEIIETLDACHILDTQLIEHLKT